MLDFIGWYKIESVRVVDADTLLMTVCMGGDFYIRQRVRLARINAPEACSVDGGRAAAWLETLLAGLDDDKLFLYTRWPLDMYGRHIGEVYYTRDGNSLHNLSDELRNAGHAAQHDYHRATLPDTLPAPLTLDTNAQARR